MSKFQGRFRKFDWGSYLQAVGVAVAALLIPAFAGAQTPSTVVAWEASLPPPGTARRGIRLTAKLEAKIQDGWHIYSISQLPGGPTPTVISVPKDQPVREAGPVIGPAPHSAYDPNFRMQTEYYLDAATFRIPLRVAPGAALGPAKATIDVVFQACNDRLCLPPATTHVSLGFRVAPRDRKAAAR